MRFDLFSSARLYKALEEAEYPDLPSERTVRDWIKNDSAPQGARIYAAKALRMKKETPAEAGAPTWAIELSDKILSAIEKNHQTLMDRTAAQYADLIDRLLGPDSDDGALPQSKGPKPRQPGPNRGPQGPSAPPTG